MGNTDTPLPTPKQPGCSRIRIIGQCVSEK